MENIPPNLQELLLIGFHIAAGDREPNLKGLILTCGHGEARFLLTRAQLLKIAEACQEAAESMPKPS